MSLRAQVQQTWQHLSSRERKITRAYAKGSNDANLRLRCKIVLALVQGNFVMLLNPDTIVCEGALRKLYDFLTAHPKAAAAGPKQPRPGGGSNACLIVVPSAAY